MQACCIYLVCTTLFAASAAIESADIHFAIEFIKGGNSPNAVLENLCLEKDSKYLLYNEFASHNIHFMSYNSRNSSEEPYRLLHKRFIAFTVVTDMNCNFDQFYDVATKDNLLVLPNVWLVFGDNSHFGELNYYIPINSLLIIPKYIAATRKWQLTSYYKTHYRLKKYLENNFGTWTIEGGLNLKGAIMITRNRSDFMRMPLRVSYVLSMTSSFERLNDYREKHLDNLTRIGIILMQLICDLWNATHIKIYRSDWGFEHTHPTKFFTKGLFADLLHGRADVGGSGSFMRLQHFKHFLVPKPDFRMSLIFRAPPLAYYSNLFLLPFNRSVWLAFALLVIVGGVLIRVIFVWEKTVSYFVAKAREYEETSPGVVGIVIMQLAIICQMDFFYEPKSTSGRLATFVVLMTSTFVYTAFCARIVLLLQSNTNSIKDVGDLYRAGYDFGAENYTFNRFYFRGLGNRSDEYWRRMIYENRMKTPSGIEKNFVPVAEGVRMLAENYLAMHAEEGVAYYLIEKAFTNDQKCALRSVNSIYKSEILHTSVPKNSTYFEFLVMGERKIAESGIHSRQARIWFNKKPKCEGSGNFSVSVGIIECYFAFLIFGIGFCLSLIIFMLELITARYLKSHSDYVRLLFKTSVRNK